MPGGWPRAPPGRAPRSRLDRLRGLPKARRAIIDARAGRSEGARGPSPHFAKKDRIARRFATSAGPEAPLYSGAGREADLPAQEAQARPDPRVPRSHAHAQRPPDHQAPAPQGSQAADAVTVPRERRRRGRLSRSGDFDRVYREGRSHANRFLVLYASRAASRTTITTRSASGLGEPQGRRRRREKCGEAGTERGVLVAGRHASAWPRLRPRRASRRQPAWSSARAPRGRDRARGAGRRGRADGRNRLTWSRKT